MRTNIYCNRHWSHVVSTAHWWTCVKEIYNTMNDEVIAVL